MGDRVGQHLGNYELIGFLGEGSFAEVYLGKHIHLKNLAAIKVLRTALPDVDQADFVTEAQRLVRLRQTHIVRLLEFGIEGNVPFLSMEYAPNGTLRTRHPKGSRVPLEVIISYVEQAADALQYLHNQKMVHRDVKPDNILLGPHQELLLSDLGIAAVAHTTGSIVGQGQAGTPPYMAPEQIQGYPRPASDQYALGIVTYEWLCGMRPFEGNPLALMYQHLHNPPPTLRGRLPTISPFVEEVVFRALAKDPKERFASVRDFAVALAQAYAGGIHFASLPSQTPAQIEIVQEPSTFSVQEDTTAFSQSEAFSRLTGPLAKADLGSFQSLAVPPLSSSDSEAQQEHQAQSLSAPPAAMNFPDPIEPWATRAELSSDPPTAPRYAISPFIPLRGALPKESLSSIPNVPQLPLSSAIGHATHLQARSGGTPRSLPLPRHLVIVLFTLLVLLVSAIAVTNLIVLPASNDNKPNTTAYGQTSNAVPKSTSTPSVVIDMRVLVTATAIANMTATAQAPASATAGVIQTATAGQPVYQDPLNDPNNSATQAALWDGTSYCGFQSDGYHVTQGTSGTTINFRGCRETGNTYKNATIAVDMDMISGHTGGLFFRLGTDGLGNYSGYLFEVDSQGNYKISTVTGGTPTPLPGHDWTKTPALKQGFNVKNTLQVIMSNNSFLFYANGIFLTQVTDTTFNAAGDIGFLATTQDTNANIVYSNLKVYPLS